MYVYVTIDSGALLCLIGSSYVACVVDVVMTQTMSSCMSIWPEYRSMFSRYMCINESFRLVLVDSLCSRPVSAYAT